MGYVRHALLAFVCGCAVLPTGIELSWFGVPDGYEPMTPLPANYEQAWKDVEACSGLKGDFSRVRFYVYPHREWIGAPDVVGFTRISTDQIWLVASHMFLMNSVRHEMLHALYGKHGHPMQYWNLCKAIVTPPPGR